MCMLPYVCEYTSDSVMRACASMCMHFCAHLRMLLFFLSLSVSQLLSALVRRQSQRSHAVFEVTTVVTSCHKMKKTARKREDRWTRAKQVAMDFYLSFIW